MIVLVASICNYVGEIDFHKLFIMQLQVCLFRLKLIVLLDSNPDTRCPEIHLSYTNRSKCNNNIGNTSNLYKFIFNFRN